ncbi:unnamed protein product [Linum trigynum]|uniref:Uncharacterized protein n=1 Tax=Linum trigynum TaxID=586398 RepID=A0AAV2D182_9ROSI
MALVNWDICKAPLSKGGLGILDLASFNRAMLGKWLWRFCTERDNWWRALINNKYPNQLSEWGTVRCRQGFSGSVWANISKEYDTFWQMTNIDPVNGDWVSLA